MKGFSRVFLAARRAERSGKGGIMSSFNANTANMRQLSGELKNLKRTLHTIANEANSCRSAISRQSGSFALIAMSLGRVIRSIENDSASAGNLGVALLDIAVQYQRSENRILGITSIDLELYALIRAVEKKIVDLLKRLGIVKGGSNSDTSSYAGDPVDVTTGNYVDDIEELVIYGPCGLHMVRHYNSRFIGLGALGIGWTHNYEISLTEEEESLIVTWGDRTKEVFETEGESAGTEGVGVGTQGKGVGAEGVGVETGGEAVYHSRAGSYDFIVRGDDGFVYHRYEGPKYYFDMMGRLVKCELPKGKGELRFTYGEDGLTAVEDSYGNSLHYIHNEDGLISEVTDHTGRKVSFTYESQYLTCVEAADGLKTQYKYDEFSRIVEITGPDGSTALINEYDEDNRVTGQQLPDGSALTFLYKDNEVLFTDRNGAETTYIIDDRNRIVETRYPEGTEKFEYNKYNKRTLYTDLNGNDYRREYDSKGNILTYTDPLGNSRTFVYDSNGDRIEASAPDSGKILASYDSDHNLVERTDSLGNKTAFTYDAGLLTSVTYADESRIVFSYDEKGRLQTVCNENGAVTTYTYDETGKMVSEENGCGECTQYVYDAKDRYLKIINPAGQERSFTYEFGKLRTLKDYDGFEEKWEYDNSGRVTAYVDKAGRKTAYAYDSMSNVNLITLPNGETVKRSYDSMNRLVEECGPGESCLHMKYDPNGNCVLRDENGDCTEITYDELNRMERIRSNDGTVRSYAYDGAGRTIRICREDGFEINYSYDTEGRLVCTREAGSSSDSADHASFFTYDKRGRLIKRTGDLEEAVAYQYYPNGQIRSVQWQDRDAKEFEYDAADRLVRETSASGYSLFYTYDCLGQRTGLTDNGNRTRTWEYDAAGNVVSQKDPLGRTTTFSYSPTGKLVYMKNALGNEYRYGYDSMDQLNLLLKGTMNSEDAEKILRDPDQYLKPENDRIHLTKWVRGADGQMTARIDAQGNRSEWTYRPNGQLLSYADAEGRTASWQYDESLRTSEVRYMDRAVNAGETPLSGEHVAKYQYNELGWVTGISDWTGDLSLSYDAHGRLAAVSDHDGRSVLYDRNPAGRRTRVVCPDGPEILYRYNECGQNEEIVSEGMTASYQYDDCGRLCGKRLTVQEEGSSAARQFAERYEYLDSGKLKEIDYSDECSKQMSLAFEYDDAGNMTGRIQKNYGGSEDAVSESRKYEYDGMNRVRRVLAEMPDGKTKILEEYEYDEFGNCVHKDIDGEVTDCEYNVLEQLVRKSTTRDGVTEVTAYTYDKDGRLISEKTASCGEEGREGGGQGMSEVFREYNAQGYLTKIRTDQESVSFAVNSLGSVLAEAYAGGGQTKFRIDYSDSSMPVLGINSGNGWQSFVRDRTLSSGFEGGKWAAFVCDERGSVLQYFEPGTAWADRAGQTSYDTFGNEKGSTSAGANHSPFGYTGLSRMPLVGTWRTATREYDPQAGRFLSRDRDEFMRIFMPETLHQYQYCFGNPMIWIDPEGTDCYIFYLPEWKNEAKNDRRQLAKQYGYDESKVHLIEITSNSDFKNGWNNMGADGSDIDTVLINTHGSPYGLGDNKQFSIDSNYVSQLDDKNAENVILLGCNSGHKDHADNNVASAFARKVNGAPVIASDGTVYSGLTFFNLTDRSYKSKNDKTYRKHRVNSRRDNDGWVVYQENNGRVTTTDVDDKKMTVSEMVKELRKHPRTSSGCRGGGRGGRR